MPRRADRPTSGPCTDAVDAARVRSRGPRVCLRYGCAKVVQAVSARGF
ncbi:hypothetical protein HMPREF0004_3615 [Achromobacter piechaudii ATCC 43553]|uniref:Uncharacterized protein n=1 Tax=Achromobacter piechaudii ATCC 43553 TaxID=742159 RepID=D4XDR8_9BURK|nr:hypothetical protein HMPREF0004_3615 [Achromobacter piechaudii ATCC 43553]